MSNFKYLLLFLLLFTMNHNIQSQTKLNKGNVENRENPFENDSTVVKRSKGFKKVASIDMYLQFNKEPDSIVVDTTLTIKKHYKFNYLQRDNFGLVPFANIGQTYNALTFDFLNKSTIPFFGARAKHYNYMDSNDIKYYEVPTPWTRLTYKTAFEQGQMLDAFFTINLSRQFNFSIAYKGLRSLGNYQNALTSSGNFRFTSNYKTKNKRYRINGHVVMQDIFNQENGGLRDEDVENFTSGDEEFIDRSVFDMNFDNAENNLIGKRFVLSHSYDIIKDEDSLKRNNLVVTQEISFEDKYYQFKQNIPAPNFFGSSFTNDINDKMTLEDFNTKFGLRYYNRLLGDISFELNYTDLNYGYDTVVLFPSEVIPNRIKSSFIGVKAGYSKTIKFLSISGSSGINLSDEFSGYFLDANLSIKINEDMKLMGGINVNSSLPNFNFLLYQSDYINYNWYHLNDYENINTQQLNFSVKSEKFFNASIDISNIDNHTYFNHSKTEDDQKVIPEQYRRNLQHLRIKLHKEFKIGNFALDNTIMYQNVISDRDVLNVPALISRNTLYYSSQIFKKAMTIETGITFNYFTKYNMDGYDPLLAEFYTQNETELGGFPRLDFFINAKIRQTRIFLTAEHFNSSFTGYNYFSAPNNPYRDFTIRFGLVWDFFL